MTGKEFLESCGLTAEWGIRWQTPIGPVDSWYDSKAIARSFLEDEEEDAMSLICRHVSQTQVLTLAGWKWDG